MATTNPTSDTISTVGADLFAILFFAGVGIYFSIRVYHLIRYYRILRLVKKATDPNLAPLLGVVAPPSHSASNNKDVH